MPPTAIDRAPAQTREAMREELRELLATHAVRRGTFTLSSGAVSDLYVDCRVVTMMPRGMQLIGTLMLEALADLPEVRGVGGLTSGADPISAAIALSSAGSEREVPMFMVRKEPKGHGMQRSIDGVFPQEAGAKVVIVDDVITYGGSALKAIETVERETDAKVVRVLVIVDREEGGADLLRQRGYEVHALFNRQDFGFGPPPAAK